MSAIGGLAALLTGDREYFWDKRSAGSSGAPKKPEEPWREADGSHLFRRDAVRPERGGRSASAAEAAARRLSYAHPGAVAFSRTGDPATGEFADAVILRSFGDVPSMDELLSCS